MSAIIWDDAGERLYETGVKKGVLYVKNGSTYSAGVPWNGLTAVTESPSGAEASPLYADDIKYLNLMSNEEFGGTIEAYTYPVEFAVCNGETALASNAMIVGQQKRKEFGFSYVTTVGNDLQGNDYGYKIHIVYNALAAVSEKAYATVNDSPEAITFSWEFTTTPEKIVNPDTTATNRENSGYKPISCITIDSTKADADALATLEGLLYGTANTSASLPSPGTVLTTMGYAFPTT